MILSHVAQTFNHSGMLPNHILLITM